jgi:DNA-binding response OmpR family regulator
VHLLVVDDQPELRDMLARAFERESHRVSLAGSLEEARGSLAAEPPDVIVLDVELPDGSGVDLCRELRREDVRIPILLLTAHGEVRQRVEGLDAGADDFLPKPFAVAELRARVRALGRRGPIERGTVVTIADVELDLGACVATRDGEEIPVTAREWAILKLLAAKPGRVVSRATILDSVWDDVSGAASASLDTLIARIRRKLGAGAIRTVRSEGYALGGS